MRVGLASSGYMDMLMGTMPMMRSASNPSMPGFLAYTDVVWTQGERTEMYGQEYLVAYRLPISLASLASMGSSAEAPRIDSLHLQYIKASGIQTLTPAPDANKEALQRALGVGPGRTAFDDAREAARRTQTLSNAKQVALALIMYSADYDDVLPYAQDTATAQAVTMPYSKSSEIWKSNNPNDGRILFNTALGGVLSTSIPNPAEVALIYDAKEWPDGSRIIAYADGHAKVVKSGAAEVIQKSRSVSGLKRVGKPLPLQKPPTTR